MCISTDTSHHSPKATISFSFESYAHLPIAPCCEKVVSKKINSALLNINNLDSLCAPLGTSSNADHIMVESVNDPVRLSLRPIRGERLVWKALHRLSSNPIISSSSVGAKPLPTSGVEEPASNAAAAETTDVLAERLPRLLQQNQSSDKANKGRGTDSKAGSRDTSPVHLVRGRLRRTQSGAARCE